MLFRLKRYLLCLSLLITLASAEVFSQSVQLDYSDEPLNEILLDLNDRYGVQVSINSELSAKCLITLNQSFASIDVALQTLADQCQLNLTQISQVYTFREKSAPVPTEEGATSHLFQGIVVEKGSQEPLPFVTIQLSDRFLTTDENGRFSFKSLNRQEKVFLHYLGYAALDSTLVNGNNLTLTLEPQVTELDEVVVQGDSEVPATYAGEEAGRIKFTDVNNNLVPGISHNLIFNNLRLYPGIMAAGEPIADFVIWGSYAGQNHIIYDGISLFNSWGINHDIGRVNPHMIKNMEVYKGGYNVPIGDRIGGVVLVDAKAGDREQIRSDVSISNQLASAYLNIPIFSGSSALQLAGRKTYFSLSNWSIEYQGERDFIVPTYDYSDINLKFTSTLSNANRLEISAIASEDSYNGQLRSRLRRGLIEDINVNSVQRGASLKYTKSWSSGGISALDLSHSYYRPESTNSYFIEDLSMSDQRLQPRLWTNSVQEFTAKFTQTFPATKYHQLQATLGWITNQTEQQVGGGRRFIRNTPESLGRFTGYLHDQIQWNQRFSMQLGIKADLPTTTNRLYLQPRINGRYRITEQWNAQFGWGIYKQFITRNPAIDELGNRADVWEIADDVRTPVPESVHHVLGISYHADLFDFVLEGYYKNESGFSRYVLNWNADAIQIEGSAQAIGMDAFIRKKLNLHEFRLAYSLGRVRERFENERNFSVYRLAPQSQQHEIKGSATFNFYPISLSLVHVYGSGFPNTTIRRNTEDFAPYARTDLALQYSFHVNHLSFDAGLSLLNLFNQRNIRLNQSVNVPDGQVINTLGIPFTALVYLNIRY
ncbi:MAG: carboxypeptidase-like regulatory domain-containing protein [Bacteroidota bacterium]